ncbi:MAG: META domain-containing protein [Chitinophagaceae bacterium]
MNTRILIIVLFVIASMACNSTRKSKSETVNNAEQNMPVNDDLISEKYWKLKTLEGRQITMKENQEREIYFILKNSENRVQGFAGCNTINGTYTLEKGNRIRFSQMATTMKLCPDVAVNESEFLEVFKLADNYTLVNDTLSLNVGRRAPLAVFEAVYFK